MPRARGKRKDALAPKPDPIERPDAPSSHPSDRLAKLPLAQSSPQMKKNAAEASSARRSARTVRAGFFSTHPPALGPPEE